MKDNHYVPAVSLIPLKASLDRLNSNFRLAETVKFWDPVLFRALRDGVIQAFEYTYDAGLTTLERALENRVGSDRIEGAEFRDRVQLAEETGLPVSLDEWLHFREMRNLSSETCDEAKADHVYFYIPRFVSAVTSLLAALERY